MYSNNVRSILDQANELLEAGKPKETLSRLRALDEDSCDSDDRLECALLRAWALHELGRLPEALRLLEPLEREFDGFGRLHCTVGVILCGLGEFERAARELERALAFDAEDEVALTNLGLVYERMREYEPALRLYERAGELGADLDWLLQRISAVQAECGELRKARSTLRRYLSLVPEDCERWIELGILHSDDQEFDCADECYRVAETLRPRSAALRLNWGVTAVRACDLDEARRQLGKLEDVDTTGSRSQLLRAFIAEEEGQLQRAADRFDQALARAGGLEKQELAYTFEMAMDFFSRHDDIEACESLVRRAFRSGTCTVELCEAYREATGDVIDAATWFSVVLEADFRAAGCDAEASSCGATSAPERYRRTYQCVANDRDQALQVVVEFAERMGEQGVRVREIRAEEPIENTYTGIYEVERDGVVLTHADD